jgi:hypothetical protein
MVRRMKTVGAALLVVMAAPVLWAQEGGQTVQATGQAAIYGTDLAHARDKAIEDAMRKAVEQAMGAMISSETVTANYELISDKILSQSKGYVRNYKVLSEGKEDGVMVVKIEAQVSAGNLQNDLKGVLAVLKSKNMPRVLIMVAEQNVGQAGAAFWWGNKAFSTNLDAVENAFIDNWTPKGLKFVDRQALQGKLSVGQAMSSAEPSDGAVKEFGLAAGAEVVVIGKAVASDVGPIMGTQMHSIRANISLRALNLDNGEILATSTQTQAVGHIDPTTGGTQALQKVATKAADDLLAKILAQWEGHVSGPASVKLTLKNVGKQKFLRDISEVLRNQVRGVSDVRQRSFANKVGELEVEIKGSAQDLAEQLEDKKFPGFAVEVEAVTANTVIVTVK